MFRHFLVHNQIKDKQIPNSYPQLQGKIEAYNKVVKNEFLAVEDIPNTVDGKLRYDIFVKAYNETREHGGLNSLTPSEVFLQRLITSTISITAKQQSVTHVGTYNETYLCKYTISPSSTSTVTTSNLGCFTGCFLSS
jgi:hypothetical protein